MRLVIWTSRRLHSSRWSGCPAGCRHQTARWIPGLAKCDPLRDRDRVTVFMGPLNNRLTTPCFIDGERGREYGPMGCAQKRCKLNVYIQPSCQYSAYVIKTFKSRQLAPLWGGGKTKIARQAEWLDRTARV